MAGAIGVRLVNTNRGQFELIGGLAGNNEQGVDTDSTRNIEALFGLNGSYYTYNRPKTNLDARVQYFPSLEHVGATAAAGQFRRQARDVEGFLPRTLTGYDSSDTAPPNPTAARNDVGLTLSVGWRNERNSLHATSPGVRTAPEQCRRRESSGWSCRGRSWRSRRPGGRSEQLVRVRKDRRVAAGAGDDAADLVVRHPEDEQAEIRIGRTRATRTTTPKPSIRKPVSATVAANLGPDAIPTCARNTVSPRLRSTRLAEAEWSSSAGGAPQVAEDQRHDQHARQPEGDRADAGERDGDRADQEAERHAQADGDVAELGGPLDRVAEEHPHGREVARLASMPTRSPNSSRASGRDRTRRRLAGPGSGLPPCRPAGEVAEGPTDDTGSTRRP